MEGKTFREAILNDNKALKSGDEKGKTDEQKLDCVTIN